MGFQMRKIFLASAAALAALSAAFAMIPAAPAATVAVAVENESGTAFDAAETFLRHLRNGAYREAYALATPQLRSNVSAETFRKELAVFQRIGMQTVTWGSPKTKYEFMVADTEKGTRWNVYQSEFTGDLTARGGNAVLRFHWINDDGTWRLMSFRWDNAPVQTSQAR